MQDARPAPLVPADVDLRDFSFMPLDVRRLRDSDLAADETPEACWAAVLLWCASWHQVPAASVPNSDQWLAKQCGYVAQGKVSPRWKEVRKGALRGWVECADGRLYHPVVAAKAMEAWESKLIQRWKTECARVKKHNQRHRVSLRVPEYSEWLSQGCPQGQPLPVPEDKKDCPRDVPRETRSKGQGQGSTQDSGTIVPADPPAGGPAPNVVELPVAAPPDAREIIWRTGVTLLTDTGIAEGTARAFLASLCKAHGEIAVAEKVAALALKPAADPRSWLRGALNGTHRPSRPASAVDRVRAAAAVRAAADGGDR
ncbi:MAG: YdaU family protein [Gammaproteobacteria bacterium]|nr:YdaU family protein [Gammaproteobacteria bacterium]